MQSAFVDHCEHLRSFSNYKLNDDDDDDD